MVKGLKLRNVNVLDGRYHDAERGIDRLKKYDIELVDLQQVANPVSCISFSSLSWSSQRFENLKDNYVKLARTRKLQAPPEMVGKMLKRTIVG